MAKRGRRGNSIARQTSAMSSLTCAPIMCNAVTADPAADHDDIIIGSCLRWGRGKIASVLEPSCKLPVLFFGKGRVEMFDRDVGRGDTNALGGVKGIEAILAIVVAHPGGSGTTERHGLDEQVNVHQIHAASTKGQLADEPGDGFMFEATDK